MHQPSLTSTVARSGLLDKRSVALHPLPLTTSPVELVDLHDRDLKDQVAVDCETLS